MTYARALRWTAGAAMATAALLVTTPAPATAATRASDSASASAFEDLAGSSAGAGRERPGRPVGEPANPETVLAARPVPELPRTEPAPALPAIPAEPPVSPVIGALGTEPNERAADLAAHILPLGTGFTLMGLGLGFMGMRLRRGA